MPEETPSPSAPAASVTPAAVPVASTPIASVPPVATTPDSTAVAAEQSFIDGSGSEKYSQPSDWTQAAGAGLDYPGGAAFDPTPSSPEPAPESVPTPAPAPAIVKPKPGPPQRLDPPARTPYN